MCDTGYMNKFTLITGASSGIGLEFARIATREKRNLLLIARDEPKLLELQKEILSQKQAKNNKLQVEVLAIDLSKNNSAQKVLEFCEKKNIFINELINNAGFGDYGNFADSKLATQISMINLNIKTVTELTHLLLPEMINQKEGRVLTMGSVAAFLPGPLMSVYFATKNYVLSFSRALHEELRGSGVTVTCLCPGPTNTGFGKAAHVSETHSTAHPKTTAREVAEFGWYQMQTGEPVAIYGTGNKISIFMTKFVPRNLLPRLVKRIQK